MLPAKSGNPSSWRGYVFYFSLGGLPENGGQQLTLPVTHDDCAPFKVTWLKRRLSACEGEVGSEWCDWSVSKLPRKTPTHALAYNIVVSVRWVRHSKQEHYFEWLDVMIAVSQVAGVGGREGRIQPKLTLVNSPCSGGIGMFTMLYNHQPSPEIFFFFFQSSQMKLPIRPLIVPFFSPSPAPWKPPFTSTFFLYWVLKLGN